MSSVYFTTRSQLVIIIILFIQQFIPPSLISVFSYGWKIIQDEIQWEERGKIKKKKFLFAIAIVNHLLHKFGLYPGQSKMWIIVILITDGWKLKKKKYNKRHVNHWLSLLLGSCDLSQYTQCRVEHFRLSL